MFFNYEVCSYFAADDDPTAKFDDFDDEKSSFERKSTNFRSRRCNETKSSTDEDWCLRPFSDTTWLDNPLPNNSISHCSKLRQNSATKPSKTNAIFIFKIDSNETDL